MIYLEEQLKIVIENLAIRAIKRNKYSLKTIADICELPLEHVKYLKRFSAHTTLKKIMKSSPKELDELKILMPAEAMRMFKDLFYKQSPLAQKYTPRLIEAFVEKHKMMEVFTTETEFFWILRFVNNFLSEFTEDIKDINDDDFLDTLMERYEEYRRS